MTSGAARGGRDASAATGGAAGSRPDEAPWANMERNTRRGNMYATG